MCNLEINVHSFKIVLAILTHSTFQTNIRKSVLISQKPCLILIGIFLYMWITLLITDRLRILGVPPWNFIQPKRRMKFCYSQVNV
jgi:hypothetical protein